MRIGKPSGCSVVICCQVLLAVSGCRAAIPPVDSNPIIDRAVLVDAIYESWGRGPTAKDEVAPEVTLLAETDCGDHIRRYISYLVEANDKAFAYLLIPKSSSEGRKLPLLLCPHPTGREGKDRVIGNYRTLAGDPSQEREKAWRSYGLDLVRRGYIVFAPDRAGFGQRARYPDEANWKKNFDAAKRDLAARWPQWQMHAKAVWDLRRALDFLVGYESVDADRIGIIGHSLGGWDSQFMAALDTRIRAAVVNAAGNIDFRRELWTDRKQLEAYLKKKGVQNLHTTTNLLMMSTAPRPLLYIKALNDMYEKGQPNFLEGFREMVEYYRKVAGRSGEMAFKVPFAIYFHNDLHSFELDARILAYTWLDRQLMDN